MLCITLERYGVHGDFSTNTLHIRSGNGYTVSDSVHSSASADAVRAVDPQIREYIFFVCFNTVGLQWRPTECGRLVPQYQSLVLFLVSRLEAGHPLD